MSETPETPAATKTPASTETKDAPKTPAEPENAFEHKFEPAAEFEGERPGFVFKLDADGLGYYRDYERSAKNYFRELERFSKKIAAEEGKKWVGKLSWLTEESDREADEARTAAKAEAKAALEARKREAEVALAEATAAAAERQKAMVKLHPSLARKQYVEPKKQPYAPELSEGGQTHSSE
jgi:hypothetical protein